MPLKLNHFVSTLSFEYPFTISGGRTKTVQQALIIKLERNGYFGFGEAPAISYYNIPIEKMIEDLSFIQAKIENLNAETPEQFYSNISSFLPNNSFLRCALDMAFWDAFGKENAQPLYKLFGANWSNNLPITDYTLGIDHIEKLISKMNAHPWPVYKIKVGSENDLLNLTTLRQNSTKPFRIDANAGWKFDEALLLINKLKDLNIELIEQPLAVLDLHLMPQLKQLSSIPLFADESCVAESDVDKCVAGFHGINIKLTKCGGITPALRMIKNARQKGIQVMMGSMNESSIGSAAIANFLPLLDFVDMDGPLLLTSDLASGLKIKHGKIELSGAPGLGIDVSENSISSYN
jgi:L-alanine-DL-glutamate epimerase-like enolase superfamily enzyme